MNLLEKIAKIGVVGFQAFAPGVAQVAPQAIPALTGIGGEIGLFAQIVSSVQAIGKTAGLDGPTKFKVASEQIKTAILASSMMVGHSIDSAVLDKIAGEFTQATFDLLTAIDTRQILDASTLDKPAATIAGQ